MAYTNFHSCFRGINLDVSRIRVLDMKSFWCTNEVLNEFGLEVWHLGLERLRMARGGL